ncbi:hypothetical protein [[Mycoplasma] testudinis]|uniref:hypothetical protein n=1 Tax=[Mycoplasma] testudinis TaxID=33924 RepID=UPI00048151BB|nr:hypothetical protein [[Mycoplasma] testudinis]
MTKKAKKLKYLLFPLTALAVSPIIISACSHADDSGLQKKDELPVKPEPANPQPKDEDKIDTNPGKPGTPIVDPSEPKQSAQEAAALIKQVRFNRASEFTFNEFKNDFNNTFSPKENDFTVFGDNQTELDLSQFTLSYKDFKVNGNSLNLVVTVMRATETADSMSTVFVFGDWKPEPSVVPTPKTYTVSVRNIAWNINEFFKSKQTSKSFVDWNNEDVNKYINTVSLQEEGNPGVVRNIKPVGITLSADKTQFKFQFNDDNVIIRENSKITDIVFPSVDEYADYVVLNQISIDQTIFAEYYPSQIENYVKAFIAQNPRYQKVTEGLAFLKGPNQEDYSTYSGFQFEPVVTNVQIESNNSVDLTIQLFNVNSESGDSVQQSRFLGKTGRLESIANMKAPNPSNFVMNINPNSRLFVNWNSANNDEKKMLEFANQVYFQHRGILLINVDGDGIVSNSADYSEVSFSWESSSESRVDINLDQPLTLTPDETNFIPVFDFAYKSVSNIVKEGNSFRFNLNFAIDFKDGTGQHDGTLAMIIR